MAAVICCGRQAVWICDRDGTEHCWDYLLQTQRGHGSERRARELRDREIVTWEWRPFPCKEIKVRRKIKVWFPASWFVFCTEIPLFLSDFAETTIAPLPVLVTVTPLTSSLGSGALLQFHHSNTVKLLHHRGKVVWKWNIGRQSVYSVSILITRYIDSFFQQAVMQSM